MSCFRGIRIGAMRGLILLAFSPMAFAANPTSRGGNNLVFDPGNFTVKSNVIDGKTVSYRAHEGIVYVKFPVDIQYQSMNIFVPTEYYEGKSIGQYNDKTAPIFLPISVGGYMPGRAGSPGPGREGQANAALVALSKGYVVAAPAARGRTCTDTSGKFTGKAPAAIIDLKAAVRYLRANDKLIPGTSDKIVSNGTSAGGALSSLLGATGNNPEYEPYLKALGAADARDDVFAVSAYCPITNLDNADMAYEWLFCGINEYSRARQQAPPSGQKPPGAPDGLGGVPSPDAGPTGTERSSRPSTTPMIMSADQVKHSQTLKGFFPAYVNSLGLKTPTGKLLNLDADGNGSFKDYVKLLVIASAQRAVTSGKDLSTLTWVKIQSGTVTDIDFDSFIRFAGRMKATPAFDGLDLGTFENGLFGTETVNAQHFSAFGKDHSTVSGRLASAAIVKLMNPMDYIGTKGTAVAQHWRIRHGAIDRDTSLAIPIILATKLANQGADVDFFLPWAQGHGGDYDLDELFSWMGRICR